ncbi:MAG: aminotransferase class I/II-fold pyridoxal phosphate-dependent enzyme [Saprospiraceae bacterium]|nr:aminotransferase class I/II-fold pyridoxal phosphate-dependent enzyme [Saprospiraceae bacterium]
MKIASRLESVHEYYFAGKLRQIAAMRAAGKTVYNLGIGSPDLPPHPDVTAALCQAAERHDAHGYQSYTGLPDLREAWAGWYARYYGVQLNPNGEILPLIGSKEGIMHIAMTFLEAGDVALTPDPGYPTYAAATRLAGATVRLYNLKSECGWLPDLEALSQTDLSKVKLMWVNFPHMPTGTSGNELLFRQLIDFGKRHNILIVNDNPYSMILSEKPMSILAVDGAKEVALELNSLSKSHNMAGWRIGMLAGNTDLLQAVLRFKSNMDSGQFLPLQQAAIAALNLGPEWHNSLNQIYRERQEYAIQIMETIGCVCEPGQQGLFVWGSIPGDYADAFALSDKLLDDHHVFLTPGGIFGQNGLNFLRISLCSPVETLKEVLQIVDKSSENPVSKHFAKLEQS